MSFDCVLSWSVPGSTWYNILRGGLEVAGGLVAGIILGFVIQYFPSVDQVGPADVSSSSCCSPLTVYVFFFSPSARNTL